MVDNWGNGDVSIRWSLIGICCFEKKIELNGINYLLIGRWNCDK